MRANVVDATLAPRVAPQNAPCREDCSPHGAVLLHRTYSVRGTRWVIPAHFAVQRRDDRPIDGQKADNEISGECQKATQQIGCPEPRRSERVRRQRAHARSDPGTSRLRHRETSARSCENSALADAGRARMTTSVPSGTVSRNSAQIAFRRRRTVLRTTAVPTCLLMMKPNRGARWSAPGNTEVTRRGPPHRAPRRTTCR
ncbi:hypothetical protein FM104_15425 [Microbacterium esteraromaticum]|uniref:Uncharacterized protein n=1 Tax=Microbacterium esteraromaticum TaxID=57043 RepID=A0A1R4KR60_9MICO|nr:hypothetical protein FM104_15425 [Microbacterium esteraromaticum]